MEYLVTVNEVQSIQQLLHHFLNLSQGKLDVGIAEQTSQVMLTELKHQEECALETIVWRG